MFFTCMSAEEIILQLDRTVSHLLQVTSIRIREYRGELG